MAGKQVITVSLDGKLSGLDHKSKGLDLRQFGKADTQRATVIEWDSLRQKWWVCWVLKCMPEGETQGWTAALFRAWKVKWTDFNGVAVKTSLRDSLVFFKDYEDAVAAEVAVIQAMQLSGKADSLFN